MADSAEATLRFDTADGAVSSTTAGNAILTLDEAARAFQQERQEHKRFIQKVRPPREGSFVLLFEFLVLDDEKKPRLPQEHPFISRYFQILLEFFAWKQRLLGALPELHENSTILFQGQAYRIDPIAAAFLEPTSVVSQFAARTFRSVEADPAIRAVELFAGKENTALARVERPLYPVFAVDSIPVRESKARRLTERVALVVESPVLTGRGIQWRFVYKGRGIGARIADDLFLDRVKNSSERFSNGDILDAKLAIDQACIEGTDMWIDRGYTVLEVYRHVPFRPDGGTLLDDLPTVPRAS